jgi:hypothetical protein
MGGDSGPGRCWSVGEGLGGAEMRRGRGRDFADAGMEKKARWVRQF